MTASIVPGAMSWPSAIRSDSSETTAFAASHRVGVAVERDDVAAQVELAVEVRLERAQHGVVGARQLGGHDVVELELRAHQESASLTLAETRLPSARPPTLGISTPMTLPMSAGVAAPDSAIASATSASSSSSPSSAGR